MKMPCRPWVLGFMVSWLVALAVGVSGEVVRSRGEAARQIELAFLNQTYRDLDPGLVPIQQGPLRIGVSSPEHRLQVFSNAFAVRPVTDESWAAELRVDLEGDGRLLADVDVGGAVSQLVDDVTARRQWIVARGEIRVARAKDGFRIELVTAGPPPTVEIQSALGAQIVTACQGIALLLGLDCDGLERGLSVVQIPMPDPGTAFLLPEVYLNEAERSFFEGLVSPGTTTPERAAAVR